MLERRPGTRPGNVARVEIVRAGGLGEAGEAYEHDETDLVLWSVPAAVPEEERVAGPAAAVDYIVFDHRHPPFDDVELRRALAHGLDRTGLAEAVAESATPAEGDLVPPALQGHTPDIALRFDPERARAHLARSGFDGELRLVSSPAFGRIGELLASSWEASLGLPTAVERAASSLPTALPRGSLAIGGWFPGYPDPEYFLRLLLHSEAADNFGRWSYGPFDELIERARREPDGRRLELFHEADRMAVADQVAVIPLLYGRSRFSVKPWVRGWWEFGKSWSSFADLEIGAESPRAGDGSR